MLQRSPPDETAAIELRVAFEPVVGVVVEKQLHVFVRRVVESVFQRHIVEERLLAVDIASC